MAWPWRKAISIVVSAVLLAASFAALGIQTAQAYSPPPSETCLRINDQNELVSALFCSGALLIPDRVIRIKPNAFYDFNGSVSFGPNSRLTDVEWRAFYNTGGLRSILFPPSLNGVAEDAIVDLGNAMIYFQRRPNYLSNYALKISHDTSFVSPFGVSVEGQWSGGVHYDKPLQIDCNQIDGKRDILGTGRIALEFHNCKNPLDPNASNPPDTFGGILNEGLTESVSLESTDGSHHVQVRLRNLGTNGQRLAFTQEMDGSAFSSSVFGDEFELPVGVRMSCQLSPSTPLPAGITLTSDCQLTATDTTNLSSSTTDITVNWSVQNGIKNSWEISQNNATPIEEVRRTGSVGIRISLRKSSQLTAGQVFQLKLATAKFSGTVRDWKLAISAYRDLPPDQIPAGLPDWGIRATLAVEEFEAGTRPESATWTAVDAFKGEAAPGSTYFKQVLDHYRFLSARSLVSQFEAGSVRAKVVFERLGGLPEGAERDLLLDRFQAHTKVLFSRVSTLTDGIRTIEFNNPYEVETFEVPTGVSELNLTIIGAEGSQGGESWSAGPPDRAGYKGQVTGRLPVTSGQLLTVGVGGAAGDTNRACSIGAANVVNYAWVAKGGVNPLGGYSGGNSGSPGTGDCSGNGGAGGAASVVQLGSPGNPTSLGTLVAGGSAGSGGSSLFSTGPLGSATFFGRGDLSTYGDSATSQWFNFYFADHFTDQNGGALGGGGGGAVGGAVGGYNYSPDCGMDFDICPNASSPGENSTAGFAGLTASYVPYTFETESQANGKVTIAFVEPPVVTPPVSSPAPSDGPTGGSTNHAETPSTSPSPTPSPTSPGPITAPDSPRGVIAKPFWKGAEVSWSAPTKDGGSPITGYEVTASTGQICQSDKLTCRLTGLKPGQLLELFVRARNAVGFSAPAQLQGAKVFIPLSLNLWQLKPNSAGLSSNLSNPKLLKPKLLNPSQLRTLHAMLVQDAGGFTLTVRLARNASKFSRVKLQKLLADETRAIKTQLRAAGLLSKVKIQSAVLPPDSKAKRPSVILVVRKP